MVKCGNTVTDNLGWKQVITPFEPSLAFSRFTARDFQVLWQFFSKSTAKAFFDVSADGIQASYLLLCQFASAKILFQNFRIMPKVFEQLPRQLVDAERFQPVSSRI